MISCFHMFPLWLSCLQETVPSESPCWFNYDWQWARQLLWYMLTFNTVRSNSSFILFICKNLNKIDYKWVTSAEQKEKKNHIPSPFCRLSVSTVCNTACETTCAYEFTHVMSYSSISENHMHLNHVWNVQRTQQCVKFENVKWFSTRDEEPCSTCDKFVCL